MKTTHIEMKCTVEYIADMLRDYIFETGDDRPVAFMTEAGDFHVMDDNSVFHNASAIVYLLSGDVTVDYCDVDPALVRQLIEDDLVRLKEIDNPVYLEWPI